MKNIKPQLAALWRERTVGQVAFSASLVGSGSGVTLGPFNRFTPLAFKHVFSNIGNAYNPNTGVFTAPVKGAYHFELYAGAPGQARPTGAVLMKNGARTVIAYEHQTNGFSAAANGATLLLEANEAVYVQLWPTCIIFDNLNYHSSFSGHLLFPMSLHWLPVAQRIDFKTALLVFKSLYGQAPKYISDMLVLHEPSRTLRTSGTGLLLVPRVRTKHGPESGLNMDQSQD
ncbi:hypothetical protein WMY93_026988 [Mugilogobius chulae]|uniref:C1q domain-containing protein n=1 Tax=Mugilogobius chulae TaxID=88201 RepID=A0AAW0N0M7_9GOBI